MRKLLSVILISSFAMALVSCGGTSTASSTADSAATESTQAESVSSDISTSESITSSVTADANMSADDVAGESVSASDIGTESASSEVSSEDDTEYYDEDEQIRQYIEQFQSVFKTFPSFTTENMDGETVTSDIFAGKDITMVNFWGTYCPPCIAEMPYIQMINERLPENAQILGLVIDVSVDEKTSLQEGLDIISDAGVTYENIVLSDDLMGIASSIMAVPTTVFVDSEGNLVGEVIIGANPDGYIDQFTANLDGWTFEG